MSSTGYKRGWSTTASRKPRRFDEPQIIEELTSTGTEGEMSMEQGKASAGASVSVGMSTPFAREKWEVSAWCTLPCDPTPEAIESAFLEAREWATQMAEEHMNDMTDRMQPIIADRMASEG